MKSERYERVMNAINLETPDRVPWALWGHFGAGQMLRNYSWEKSRRDGEESAKSHMALLRELDYKMDMLKVTPNYMYMDYIWGSKFQTINNDEWVSIVDPIIKKPDDWEKLWVLDPKKELRENLRAVEILSRDIGRRMPFIYSIASPLTQAKMGLATPDRLYADMQSNEDALKEGLETIAQTCIDFGRACIDEGATGIFYGIGSGGNYWSRMSRDQLDEYALGYDKKVLEAISDAPIKLLHICSNLEENPQKNGGLMEEGWFKKYPVNAINWSDKDPDFTSGAVAKKIYGDKFCIIGGVDRTILRTGTPQQVSDMVKESIKATAENGGFIIGPSCTIKQDTPLENYNVVAKSVERYGRYKKHKLQKN